VHEFLPIRISRTLKECNDLLLHKSVHSSTTFPLALVGSTIARDFAVCTSVKEVQTLLLPWHQLYVDVCWYRVVTEAGPIIMTNKALCYNGM